MIESLRRLATGILPTLVPLWISGCVSAHIVHQDSEFTADALRKGNIAIGGVSFRDSSDGSEAVDARQTASAIDHIEREIKSRRPELGLKRHTFIKGALGDAALSKVLDAVGSNAEIQPETLAAAKRVGADYIMFTVVSYDTIDRYVTNNTDVRNVYDNDEKIIGQKVTYHTTAQTKRSVSAEYQVYDTSSGKRVWASESSNSRSRTRHAQSEEGYPPAPDYGPAPTLSRVLRSMTSAAVKELPAPDSQPEVQSAPPNGDSTAE